MGIKEKKVDFRGISTKTRWKIFFKAKKRDHSSNGKISILHRGRRYSIDGWEEKQNSLFIGSKCVSINDIEALFYLKKNNGGDFSNLKNRRGSTPLRKRLRHPFLSYLS